jgi:hypothetical protein
VRLWDNLAYGRALEDLLTNQLTRDARWPNLPGIVLGVLIAIGLLRLARHRSQSAAAIYSIVFALAVGLYWPEIVIRLMTPLLPFLMAYLVAGSQAVAERSRGGWLYLPAAGCLALYLLAGYRNDQYVMREDRALRAPGLLVTYPGNQDLARLAVWWKEQARESDVYACLHPNVVNVITGRAGVLYENNGQSGGLERSMQARGARFLLLDLNGGADRAADRQASSSGQFLLLRESGSARLYALAPR